MTCFQSPTTTAIDQNTLLTPQQVRDILLSDATSKRILEKDAAPKPSEVVGVRLNLNVLKSTGKAIQTIHYGNSSKNYQKNKGLYSGEARSYAQAVRLKNAFFNVNQVGREAIAMGVQNKFPMASVDGEFVSTEVPKDFTGIEVKFNPKNHHLFVDEFGQAIKSASDVIILGNRAYACGEIVYHTPQTAPKRAGDYPTQTQVLEEPVVLDLSVNPKPKVFQMG